MTELQAIARVLRRPEEQLRVSYDLLRQGYAPEFLATYRADETGQIDRDSLKKMRRLSDYFLRVENHRRFVKDLLSSEQLWGEQLEAIVREASTVAEIDLVTRGLRSKKSSRALVEKQSEVSRLGQAILTLEGEPPQDLVAWVAQEAKVDLEEANVLLAQVRRWLQLLLHEEPKLLDRIAKHLRRKSIVTVTMLQNAEAEEATSAELTSSPEPAGKEQAESDQESATQPQSEPLIEPEATATDEPTLAESTSGASTASESFENSPSVGDPVQHGEVAAQDEVATEGEGHATPEANEVRSSSEGGEGLTLTFAAPKPKRPLKKSKAKAQTPKPKSDANLSPRQRRRRWLRSVLESYAKLRKPLDRLSPYQILMLGRGQRSQLIKLNLEYDIQPLIHAARESLCSGRHPLHHWLLELAEEGLRKQILPKLEQDLMAEYEEIAHQELTDMAVVHLEECLNQKPIRNKSIMVIDAVGPKSAAVAVIDKSGNVLHTDEIACNSIRNDVLTANVTLLGEIAHRFQVEVVGLSNGPARRFLIHTVKELLRQSSGRLLWSMIDRAGADAYGATRLCLQELPSISRRHRSAVWLARRMQDPLCELLKIDPSRMRLGSYQRELPEGLLQESLKQAISEAIARRGIDLWNASELTLSHVPGVSEAIAKKIVELRNADQLSTRQALHESLRELWSEMGVRQALGFLRIFGSDEPLDATSIHPDDYRLAQKLIANAGMPAPNNSPSGWIKPDLKTVLERAAAQKVDAELSSKSDEDSDSEGAESETSNDTEALVATTSLASSESAASSEDASPPVEPVAASDESKPEESSTEPASEITSDAPSEEAPVESASIDGSAAKDPERSAPPELSIDVEKLARGWQVGRERLRYVARALQQPFADFRDSKPNLPLLDKVPSLEDLKPGMCSWAVVIGVAEFGAFADLGPDCSGLIHVSRLSPHFVEDPHQVVQVGDLLQVWVVDVDQNKKRVALSALPPGMQQRPRREESFDGPQQGRRDARGPANDGSGRGRPQGDRRQDNRRTDDGRRDGQRGGGSFAGRGGPRRGNDQRGKGRRDHQEAGQDFQATRERKVKIDPPKPIQPISDAMQKGKEPLRSFSDLMQFMQVKREPDATDSQQQGAAES